MYTMHEYVTSEQWQVYTTLCMNDSSWLHTSYRCPIQAIHAELPQTTAARCLQTQNRYMYSLSLTSVGGAAHATVRLTHTFREGVLWVWQLIIALFSNSVSPPCGPSHYKINYQPRVQQHNNQTGF